MGFALGVRAPVMLTFMGKAANTRCVLVNVVNMEHAIWKLTAVSVMKDGQVKLNIENNNFGGFHECQCPFVSFL